jgi:transcriptional regulator with XRE-family HTH domain
VSGKSTKNTIALARFRAFFNHWLEASGLNNDDACEFLGVTPGKLNNILNGPKGVSVVTMEEIAEKIGVDLIELLILGRAIVVNEDEADEDEADEGPTDEEPAEEGQADEEPAGEDPAAET